MPSYSSIIVLLSFSLWLTPLPLFADDKAIRKPVAEVLSRAVYEEKLVPSKIDAEQKTKRKTCPRDVFLNKVPWQGWN
jgi:hypothetical protein